MSIFDHIKKIGAGPELSEEELDAIKAETENKIRNATKELLKDFENKIYMQFSEAEIFANGKMEEIKAYITGESVIVSDHLSDVESEVDKYLSNITNNLETQLEEIINDTIKRLKFDKDLIKKRFENTRNVIRATSGMGIRKNREFFDAVRTVLEQKK